ncbi:glycoside hydrolase family 3 C-terminal domain-containing protein [uncultured Draconibacterium sp.]|uniref:glycoside hydrolase family 3 C-terminal domain-containing protein n=1 Tax=uncultured Draconibacterium sp. TaxID=1573823 RepID=UPI0025CC4040|nr:glycoside hydrolase family 3 C-terminal domain-containing protein [uncultured Draconibacterium sp.]
MNNSHKRNAGYIKNWITRRCKISMINLLFSLFLFISSNGFAQEELPQLGKSSLQEVIDAMTVEEKVNLVAANGIRQPELQGQVMALGHYMYAIPRLGIPAVALNDGPAGLNISSSRASDPDKKFYATAWPSPRLLASSWDLELTEKVGSAFGHEAKEYGIGVILGPGLNIQRIPLCGRNFEYYSEDPLVSGLMTSAIVNGIQSNDVGTCIKHFVANNQETERNTLHVYMSERAMREIYLKAFEVAVKKSKPWTVMTAHNSLNGPHVSESYELLTTILRNEWGFNGFVMTDWFGGTDAIAQLKAGNDLLTPGMPYQVEALLKAIESKELQMETLDKNVERILSVIMRTSTFKGYIFSDNPDLKSNAQLARKAAAESMVLLKNDNEALPFSNSINRIALFGNSGYKLFTGGLGSARVTPAYENSIAQGLKNAGYSLNNELNERYLNYIAEYSTKNPIVNHIKELFDPTPQAPMMPIKKDVIEKLSSQNDAAVIVLGRVSGEGTDRKQEEFELSKTEKQTIKDVSEVFHAKGKKVVVVLNVSIEVETASWRDDVDAIMLAWLPGQEGGNAIADILSGKVNPSGKLTSTFPVNYDDVPSAKNFPGKMYPEKSTREFMGYPYIPTDVTYEEGIYVGYRYYNSFNVKTAYEFGFGLSYTDFKYSDLKLSATTFKDELNLELIVTNTGKVAGKETVQLYLAAPAKTMDKPAVELKKFAKTKLLAPGEAQTINFKLIPRDLASYDSGQSAWVSEAGEYLVKVGASSKDIKLSKAFRLSENLVVEKVHKVLLPPYNINELKNDR